MKLQDFDFRLWVKGLWVKDKGIYYNTIVEFEKGKIRLVPINDNVEIELWTGVCDKNNKKIFHGDILECSLKDFKTPIRFEIDWNEGNFFHLRVIKPLKRVKEVQFILRTYELSFILENSKILGNIHENKELLKEE